MENEEVVEVSPATDADLVIFSMAEMLHDQKLIVGLAKICETGKVEGKGVGWNGVGGELGATKNGTRIVLSSFSSFLFSSFFLSFFIIIIIIIIFFSLYLFIFLFEQMFDQANARLPEKVRCPFIASARESRQENTTYIGRARKRCSRG